MVILSILGGLVVLSLVGLGVIKLLEHLDMVEKERAKKRSRSSNDN